jgi:hypothetical protein
VINAVRKLQTFHGSVDDITCPECQALAAINQARTCEIPKSETIGYGLAQQKEQMKNWRRKLNDECYADLKVFVTRITNNALANACHGDDIPRNMHINNFVADWKPSN